MMTPVHAMHPYQAGLHSQVGHADATPKKEVCGYERRASAPRCRKNVLESKHWKGGEQPGWVATLPGAGGAREKGTTSEPGVATVIRK